MLVVVIVFGYVLGFYFQNRRIDDLRSEMNARFDAMEHRFDDLKDWIRAELRRVDERIDNLAARVERLERGWRRGSFARELRLIYLAMLDEASVSHRLPRGCAWRRRNGTGIQARGCD